MLTVELPQDGNPLSAIGLGPLFNDGRRSLERAEHAAHAIIRGAVDQVGAFAPGASLSPRPGIGDAGAL
ncbi:MAG TPA: hypothetical protein VFZ10_07285, partial [Geminicoccaceae bacterium]